MPPKAENQPQSSVDDIFDTYPLAIFEIDYITQRFKRVNQAFCLITGFTQQQLLSMNPVNLLDPENAQNLMESIKQVLKGQSISTSFEFKLKAIDGKDYWIIFHIKPTYRDGKLDSSIVIGFDITDRKKAEEALKESENRYRLIVETANEGVWVATPDGKTTFVNQKMADMLGYRKEELLGHFGLEFLSNPQEPQIMQNRSRLSGNQSVEVECKFNRKDGSFLWTIANTVPIHDKEGTHVANIAMHTDITERKKAEEAQRQNMLTFLQLIERSPFGIYVVNSKFRIEHMNKGSQDGAFRNVRPIIGRPFNEVMHILWSEHVAEEIISHFRHTLDTGEPYYSPRFTNPRHDVEVVESYEWELQRIMLPDGQYGVICYYFDSSKLRETERALIEAQTELKSHAENLERVIEERTKQLKDAERLATIGATAGMVGHDIRNPLQAIVGDLFIARQELEGTPESEPKRGMFESLHSIETNIFYINKIVSDLQDFARHLNPTIKDTNLRLIIAEALSNCKVSSDIEIVSKIDSALERIDSDPDFLKRIVSNLVMNAAQAMPNGGTLIVQAQRESQTQCIVLIVEDTGVGIPEEVKGKLFTPMFTTKSKGQGFGLAVVKRMVEALGGNISYESEVGKGTKFIVHLPPPQELNGKWIYKK
jgi:PAS domain S-box-containing protein